MRVDESQLSRWKHAYQVLGVPLAASANSIRQAEAPCEKMAPRSLSSWNTGSHGCDSHDGLDQRGVCRDRACAVALFRRSALRNLAATAKTSPSAIAGQQKRINGSENSEHGKNRILGKIHTGMRVRLGPLRRQVLESDLPPLVALALSCKSRAHIQRELSTVVVICCA
jgi:hypothetical protein